MRLTTWGVLRSAGVPCLVVAALLAVGEAAGQIALGGGSWLVPVVFLVLGVVHELGHVIAARAVGTPVRTVRSSRHGVALSHREGTRRSDLAVVLCGPFLALAAGLLTAVLAARAGLPVIALAGAVIGVGHVAALLVPTGDGAHWRALRRGRHVVDATER